MKEAGDSNEDVLLPSVLVPDVVDDLIVIVEKILCRAKSDG